MDVEEDRGGPSGQEPLLAAGQFQWPTMTEVEFDLQMKSIFTMVPKLDRSKMKKKKKGVEPTPEDRNQEMKESLDKIMLGLSRCYDHCVWDDGYRDDGDGPAAPKRPRISKAAPRATYYLKDPITGARDDQSYGFTMCLTRIYELAMKRLRARCIAKNQEKLKPDVRVLRDNPAKLQAVLDRLHARRQQARTSVMGIHSRELLALCDNTLARLAEIHHNKQSRKAGTRTAQKKQGDDRDILDATYAEELKVSLIKTQDWLLNAGKGKVFSLLGGQGQGKSTILAALLLRYMDWSIYCTDPYPNDLVLMLPVLEHMRESVRRCSLSTLPELLDDSKLCKVHMPVMYGAEVAEEEVGRTRDLFRNFGRVGGLEDTMATLAPASNCEGFPSTNVAVVYAYGAYASCMVKLRQLPQLQESVLPLVKRLKAVFDTAVGEVNKNLSSAALKETWITPTDQPAWDDIAAALDDEMTTTDGDKSGMMRDMYVALCGHELPWCQDAGGVWTLSEKAADVPIRTEMRVLLEKYNIISFTGPRSPETDNEKAHLLLPAQVELWLGDIICTVQGLAHLKDSTVQKRLTPGLPPELQAVEWRHMSHAISMPVSVFLPSALLADGSKIEDTPGSGTSNQAHNTTTADALTNRITDAVLLTQNGLGNDASLTKMLAENYMPTLLREAMAAAACKPAGGDAAAAGGDAAAAGRDAAAAGHTGVTTGDTAAAGDADAAHTEGAEGDAAGGMAGKAAITGVGAAVVAGRFTLPAHRHRAILAHLGDGNRSTNRIACTLQGKLNEARSKCTNCLESSLVAWRSTLRKAACKQLPGRPRVLPKHIQDELPTPVSMFMYPLLEFSLSADPKLCRELEEASREKHLPSLREVMEHLGHQELLKQLKGATKEELLCLIDSVKQVLDMEAMEKPSNMEEILQALPYNNEEGKDRALAWLVRKGLSAADEVTKVEKLLTEIEDFVKEVEGSLDALGRNAELSFSKVLQELLRQDINVAGPSSAAAARTQTCWVAVDEWWKKHGNKLENLSDVQKYLQPDAKGKHMDANLYNVAKQLCAPLEEVFSEVTDKIEGCVATFIHSSSTPDSLSKILADKAVTYFQECTRMSPQERMEMNTAIGNTYTARAARLLGKPLYGRLCVEERLKDHLNASLDSRMQDMLSSLVESLSPPPAELHEALQKALVSGMEEVLTGVAEDMQACADKLPEHCKRTIKTLLLAPKRLNKRWKPENVDENVEYKLRGRISATFRTIVRELDNKRRGTTERMTAALRKWHEQRDAVRNSLDAMKEVIEKELPSRSDREPVVTAAQKPVPVFEDGLKFERSDILSSDGLGAVNLTPEEASQYQYFKRLAVARQPVPEVKTWPPMHGGTPWRGAFAELDQSLEEHGLQRVGVACDGDRLMHALLVGLTGQTATPSSPQPIKDLRVLGTQAALQLRASSDKFREAMDLYLKETSYDGPTDWAYAMQQTGAGSDYFLLQGIVQAQCIRVVIWLLPNDAAAPGSTGKKEALRSTVTRATAASLPASDTARPEIASASSGPLATQLSGGQLQPTIGQPTVMLMEPVEGGTLQQGGTTEQRELHRLPTYGLALVMSPRERRTGGSGRTQVLNHVEAVVHEELDHELVEDGEGEGSDGGIDGGRDGGSNGGDGGRDSGRGDAADSSTPGPSYGERRVAEVVSDAESVELGSDPSADDLLPQMPQLPLEDTNIQPQMRPGSAPWAGYTPTNSAGSGPGPSRPSPRVTRSMTARNARESLLDIVLDPSILESPQAVDALVKLVWNAASVRVFANATLLAEVERYGRRPSDTDGIGGRELSASRLYSLLNSTSPSFGRDRHTDAPIMEQSVYCEAHRLHIALNHQQMELHKTLGFAKRLVVDRKATPDRLLVLHDLSSHNLYTQLADKVPLHGNWIRIAELGALVKEVGVDTLVQWFNRRHAVLGKQWTFGPHIYWIMRLT